MSRSSRRAPRVNYANVVNGVSVVEGDNEEGMACLLCMLLFVEGRFFVSSGSGVYYLLYIISYGCFVSPC